MNNRIPKAICLLLISLVFITCQQHSTKKAPLWSELPEETNLDNLPQTDFAPTLGSPILPHKNIIYAPAFLYAWDKIKEALNSTVVLNDSNSKEFKILTQTTSHEHSLQNDEYSVNVKVEDGMIAARAFFNKTLPFEVKLHKLEKPIRFGNTNVASFGMHTYDEMIVSRCKILYYKDDDHFILKIRPKEAEQVILFAKGLDEVDHLKAACKQINELIAIGKEEAIKERTGWKYNLLEDDTFAIPVIHFNISTHYKQFEGESITTTDHKTWFIEEAIQRTGFILNESGAVVESEAVVAVADSASATGFLPVTFPKRMILDKPFYILIKREETPNPYFVMKVENAELLSKQP